MALSWWSRRQIGKPSRQEAARLFGRRAPECGSRPRPGNSRLRETKTVGCSQPQRDESLKDGVFESILRRCGDFRCGRLPRREPSHGTVLG